METTLVIEYASKWRDLKDKSNTFKIYNLKWFAENDGNRNPKSFFKKINIKVPQTEKSEEENVKKYITSIMSYDIKSIDKIELVYKNDFNFIK